MSWGAILGGVIGAVVGGPLGAMAGAAIGAGIEEENQPSFSSLDSKVKYIADQDGCILQISSPKISEENAIVIHARYETGEFKKSNVDFFSDNNGYFCLVTNLFEEGTAYAYLPFGSVSPEDNGKLKISVRAFRNFLNSSSPEII